MNQDSKDKYVESIVKNVDETMRLLSTIATMCGKCNEMRVVLDLDEAYASLENARHTLLRIDKE
jgi:hypothetical protein